MKRLLARRPSPALVIACIALFVSLGGVSYGVATGFIDSREIRDNTVRTADLRNNEVRGKDIRNSTIGGRDVSLNTLTGGDINEDRLTQVPDSAKLGGIAAVGYVRHDGIGFRPLVPGSDWTVVFGQPGPAYHLDGLGYVHLRGVVKRSSIGDPSNLALPLPSGAWPATVSRFIAWSSGGAQAVVVQPNGEIQISGTVDETVALDGITYRAR